MALTERYGDASGNAVGLVENAEGVRFHCGTCKFFDEGSCRNKNPKLNDRKVKPEWCCNLYQHPGMRVIVK